VHVIQVAEHKLAATNQVVTLTRVTNGRVVSAKFHYTDRTRPDKVRRLVGDQTRVPDIVWSGPSSGIWTWIRVVYLSRLTAGQFGPVQFVLWTILNANLFNLLTRTLRL